MKKSLLTYSFILLGLLGFAQTSETKTEDNLTYEGNEYHLMESYSNAEKKYREALSRSPKNTIAQHNLGNTLFEEAYYGEAFNAYKSATTTAQSKAEKHSALHNMGNVFMNKKEYAKAVETYKEALRNNPNDDQTRYNYAVAKSLLEQEKQDQNNDKDKDKDQDKKDQDQKDKNEQNNKDNKKGDDKKEEPKDEGEDEKDQDKNGNEQDDKKNESDKKQNPKEEQDSKGQPTKLSPQQIQNLLKAMNNEEKKVQDKVNAKKAKPVKPKSKKDW
jgi:tetratricopeptide (TPR) repeat protein